MSAIDERAKSVFFEAIERGPDEWRKFLEGICSGDSQLLSRVDQLLQAHQAMGIIRTGGAETLGPTADFTHSDGPGTQIGPYKIVEQIGEGGMGAVYLAQQTEPVRRLVALKVIKAGMDSRQVLARFEVERQALALMDHPNIARVLDAGTTGAYEPEASATGRPPVAYASGSSRPFFVMELVKGVPITKFCDERKLTPRERLELFLPVCHAIQHAHQKGIIHRDIKPSNVLVALYDGQPVPKVIDFGVAKAAGQPLTERTLVTGLGAVVGTPEYMSPEQAEFNQLDIDTRSDIYSLGVLLYELLTGTTPLTHERMKDAALFEVLRAVREEEPPKPSTRLSTADELPAIAANRGTEPSRLSRLVCGEIDWIVMKALEKDRSRRYETANGLAADVERYLAGEAVEAVPPSAWYRLRKFSRRNKRALVSTALSLGMLLVLFGSLGWVVFDRAARQARIAFEVQQFLQRAESFYAENKLPEAVAEVQKARGVLGTGSDVELRQSVERRLTELETATRLGELLEDSYRDRVFAEYAEAFRNYGIDVEALSTEEAAARIAQSNIKLDLVLALDRWATSMRMDHRGLDSGRWQRLQAIARAADSDPWRMRYNAASEAGNLKTLRELADGADLNRLRTRELAALGDSLRKAGDVKASVAFLRKVQKRHPADYSINASLGWSLRSLEPAQWDEAIAYRRIAVAVRPQSPTANFYLGFSLHTVGKLDEAMIYYQTAIEFDEEHAPAHLCLANVLRDRGKPKEALVHYRKSSDLLPTDPNPLNGLAWELATCADPGLRDYARAVDLAKKVVDLSIKQKDDGDARGRDRLANYWNTLGVAQYRAGNTDEALAALQQSLDIAKGLDFAPGKESRYVCEDWLFLAMVNWKLNRKDEARQWYDRAAEWMEKYAPKDAGFRGFRTEAAELMGISIPGSAPAPMGK